MRRVLSPRDERTLVQKLQINPRAAKDLVKMLEETGTKISKDTEAANFVEINICVILKTFGHDCSCNGGFGAVASSLLRGLSGYIDIGLVLLWI